jgi:hypothetical protein
MRQKILLGIVPATLAVAAVAGSGGVSPRPIVPERLEVATGQVLVLQAHATGVQIYACTASTDASRYDWTLKAPEAELFDDSGLRIGSHYAGPTWKADDGSTVIGTVEARADAPVGGTIPWLLLAATANTAPGVFAHVAYIQRIDTSGGSAPHDAVCDQSLLGSERRVPYTATYLFYTAAR